MPERPRTWACDAPGCQKVYASDANSWFALSPLEHHDDFGDKNPGYAIEPLALIAESLPRGDSFLPGTLTYCGESCLLRGLTSVLPNIKKHRGLTLTPSQPRDILPVESALVSESGDLPADYSSEPIRHRSGDDPTETF